MSKTAEILSVGTELLLGNIANTDAQFISQELSTLGVNVFYHSVVGDNYRRIVGALELAKSRADIVITTGGLGPTYDDITKEAVAESFGRKLVLHEPSLQKIRSYFDRSGSVLTPNNERQAMLPEGCTVLENDWGTAPGCAVEFDGKHVIMLPGPPRECQNMFTHRVKPYLQKFADAVMVSRNIRIFGKGESAVEAELHDMMENMTNPTVAPYAKEGEVMLRVTAKADSADAAFSMTEPVVSDILKRLGDMVYGVDVESLEEAVYNLLLERGLTLSTAESCTGGMVSARLTNIPGISEVYKGSVVAYSNDVKSKVLGVPAELIDKHGAVSEQVALIMAQNVRKILKTDIGVSVTGVAGPAASENKPVGYVWFAVATDQGSSAFSAQYGSGRSRVRTMSVNRALDLVRRQLLNI